MSTQIFVASTAFGLATVVAALADGAFEDADRRVLVVSTNTLMPEATPSLLEVTGVQSPARPLRRRVRLQRRRLSRSIRAGGALELQTCRSSPGISRHCRRITDDSLRVIVESIQVNPAQAVCRIFGEAPIDVYADGLMILWTDPHKPSCSAREPGGAADSS